jgi:predicted ferric reductase
MTAGQDPDPAPMAADKPSAASFFARVEAHMMACGTGYTASLVFLAVNVVLFWYGVVLEYDQHTNFQRYTTVIARGAGYMLNLDCGVLLLLGSRVFLSRLRGTFLNRLLPFDHAMPKAHIFVGYLCFVAATVHGVFHVVPGIITSSWQAGFLGWSYGVGTGALLLAVFAVMVVFAQERIRQSRFELFYCVHLVGAALFFGILAMHGVLFAKLYTWKWIIGPVVIYLCDRLYRRFTQCTGSITATHPDTCTFANDVMRLQIPRPFSYRAGQYAELCIPSISKTQFHPFTIASAPHEPHITFFVKQNGDWTVQLHDTCRLMMSGNAADFDSLLQYKVRGPYGAPAEHVGQYSRVVLVSGGVGGTPFLSVVRDFVAKGGMEGHEAFAEGYGTSTNSLTSRASSTETIEQSWSARTKLHRLSNIGRKTTFFVPKPEPKSKKQCPLASVDDLSDCEDYMTTLFQRLHFYLGSTTASFATLFLSILRVWICSLVVVSRYVPIASQIHDIGFAALPRGFAIADLVCASLLLGYTVSVVVLDLLLRPHEIPLWAKVLDVAIVIPVLAGPIVLYDAAFAGKSLTFSVGNGVQRKYPISRSVVTSLVSASHALRFYPLLTLWNHMSRLDLNGSGRTRRVVASEHHSCCVSARA